MPTTTAMGSVNVLSGGMGARLFTEIREKEGLCYSVGASYQPMKDRGDVIAYAASLNHQAQRTLDKLLEELRKLPAGIEADEVDRVRVGLKTSLIMQQESTSSRAMAVGSDKYYLGRVPRLDEIQSAVDGLTADSIPGPPAGGDRRRTSASSRSVPRRESERKAAGSRCVGFTASPWEVGVPSMRRRLARARRRSRCDTRVILVRMGREVFPGSVEFRRGMWRFGPRGGFEQAQC